MRFSVFKETAAHVTRFNSRRPGDDHDQTYTMELSQFADWTPSEFRRRRCAIPHHELEQGNDYDEMIMTTEAENVTSSYGNMNHLLPKEVNWVKRGAVTSVKSTRKLITLSTQELVDCESKNCKPYRVDIAFRFIKKNGITTDRIYPYIAKYSGYCHLEKKNKPAVRIDGYYRVRRNNERALMIAVARQPVVALIEASPDFRHYSKGVFAGECGTVQDHAVTIVGYGTTPCGIPYWLVKNSWGPQWGGEGGYIRMRPNVSDKRGLCGIAMEAYYPYKYKRS
ncbi:PREDICTED: vignain-like [Erythranthe guttata]|uniref:vignain-like n=1 Tax=Erythranthe guttata TaxID=4155 RepID=UPI00064E0853|nr:PREDICTED: vignain-like [Erythranthe guttata]|eukprot:XP_012855544.1 PREDICTED: vignain-like [Erythranthe guttata]